MSDDDAIIMLRHPAVSVDIKGICYGASDIPLSAEGEASIPAIVAGLADVAPHRIYHSGLSRAERLATAIATASSAPVLCDPRFAEMNFGDWEGRTWQDVYDTVGDAMANLIHAPAHYAPDGGETVLAMRDRVVAALAEVPHDGPSIVVSHGGPISATLGTLGQCQPIDWPALVPGFGASIRITADDRIRLATLASEA